MQFCQFGDLTCRQQGLVSLSVSDLYYADRYILSLLNEYDDDDDEENASKTHTDVLLYFVFLRFFCGFFAFSRHWLQINIIIWLL